ncbi:MAG TPA: hypothetical protein VI912_00975 [Candidatus Bilamarchaeaceae archaeon]|nr:hypothetical protein [Candidatus Bilamarchaeaceae archaeon]
MKNLKLLLLFVAFFSLVYADLNIDDSRADEFKDTIGDSMESIWNHATGVVGTLFGSLQGSECSADQDWLDFGKLTWLLPAIYVATIIIIWLSVIYMFGQLFQLQNLIVFVKEEMFHSFSTIVRVLLILGTLATVDAAWYQYQISGLNPSNPDPVYSNVASKHYIDAAMVFSLQTIREMNTVFSNLLMYNTVIHTLYTSTLYFGYTWRAMYTFNLGPALKPIIDILGMSMNLLSIGVGEWVLHLFTLCLIKKWTFSLFLPLGMLLRAFPQTRAGGEAIFVLGFALAVIYPFMFVVTYEVHKIMKGSILGNEWDSSSRESIMDSFVDSSGLFKVGIMLVSFVFLSAGAFMPVFVEAGLTLVFELVKAAVYYIVILSLFMPFLNIFVTLTVAKEFGKGFGGVDINYMAVVRLI